MSRLYTINDHGTDKFYKLEKSLFINPIYRELSHGSKIMYAILRDRQDLSIANKWIDKNGFIFFYFDCNNMAELMNMSTNTVNTYKKELIKAELLLQKRQGQGNPNKLYILKPVNVEITLISDSSISKDTENAKLEVLKSLCNDTELNKTERTKLNINYEPPSGFTASFLFLFENYFGYEHRRILKEVDETNLEGLDIETFSDMVIEYFDKYGTNDKQHDLEKCSIDNVFASAIRYSMLYEW